MSENYCIVCNNPLKSIDEIAAARCHHCFENAGSIPPQLFVREGNQTAETTPEAVLQRIDKAINDLIQDKMSVWPPLPYSFWNTDRAFFIARESALAEYLHANKGNTSSTPSPEMEIMQKALVELADLTWQGTDISPAALIRYYTDEMATTSKIISTWSVIVEFIKWYNSQPVKPENPVLEVTK